MRKLGMVVLLTALVLPAFAGEGPADRDVLEVFDVRDLAGDAPSS